MRDMMCRAVMKKNYDLCATTEQTDVKVDSLSYNCPAVAIRLIICDHSALLSISDLLREDEIK